MCAIEGWPVSHGIRVKLAKIADKNLWPYQEIRALFHRTGLWQRYKKGE